MDDSVGVLQFRRTGLQPIEILRHFYGSNMYINTAEMISGIPASFPGTNLTIGSSGDKVRQMQGTARYHRNCVFLNPEGVAIDGIYGPATAESVKVFQSVLASQTG